MNEPVTRLPGEPVWLELFSSNPEITRYFYCELFGWTARDAGPEYGGYVNLLLGEAGIAGLVHNDGSSGAPDRWSLYLHAPDLAATAAKVASAGGMVVMEPMQVMDFGSMALFTGPGMTPVGAWQPGTHTGFGVQNVPGSPAWFELLTPLYDESVAFYRDVFGWDAQVMSDTTDIRYTTLGAGEQAKAGIMDGTAFLPAGVPGLWAVYFRVNDADAVVAKAVTLGATVVHGPEDTPYGRLVDLTDPSGVSFKLMG